MKITIETKAPSEMRYATLGDYWWESNGDLVIQVSDMGNWKYNAAVALHEFIEVMLTKDRGIQEPDIMAFDVAFEKARKEGDTSEPGDAPLAPYRKEHRFSENLERLFIAELGVNWKEYETEVENMP